MTREEPLGEQGRARVFRLWGLSGGRFQGRMTNKLNFDDFDPLPGQGGGGVCPSCARLGALGRQKGPFYGTSYARGGEGSCTGQMSHAERPTLRARGRRTSMGVAPREDPEGFARWYFWQTSSPRPIHRRPSRRSRRGSVGYNVRTV